MACNSYDLHENRVLFETVNFFFFLLYNFTTSRCDTVPERVHLQKGTPGAELVVLHLCNLGVKKYKTLTAYVP